MCKQVAGTKIIIRFLTPYKIKALISTLVILMAIPPKFGEDSTWLLILTYDCRTLYPDTKELKNCSVLQNSFKVLKDMLH